MAGRVAKPPANTASLSIRDDKGGVTDAGDQQVQQAVQDLQRAPRRQALTMDLVVGRNIVRHGLGRTARGYTLVPTVADATFAHAVDASNPRPELEVWINVIGVAQPRAAIEVW